MLHRLLDEEIPQIPHESQEREFPHKLYIVFNNKEDRDKAIKLIEENLQVFDCFRFIEDIGIDPKQTDLGLKLSFKKSPTHNTDDVVEFLKENSLTPLHTHFVNSDNQEVSPN